MSFVETAHTFSAIDYVRKELTKILSIISIISFIGFSVYYGYLIITNFNNLLYLILYSILFKCTVNRSNYSEAKIDDSEFILHGDTYENYGNYMKLELLEK